MKFLGEIITNAGALVHSYTAIVATTSLTTLVSLPAASYRSVEVNIQVTQLSTYHATKLLVLHNDTDANITEYATLTSNGNLATFSATVSAGNLIIQTTQGSATSATYKINIIANPV